MKGSGDIFKIVVSPHLSSLLGSYKIVLFRFRELIGFSPWPLDPESQEEHTITPLWGSKVIKGICWSSYIIVYLPVNWNTFSFVALYLIILSYYGFRCNILFTLSLFLVILVFYEIVRSFNSFMFDLNKYRWYFILRYINNEFYICIVALHFFRSNW